MASNCTEVWTRSICNAPAALGVISGSVHAASGKQPCPAFAKQLCYLECQAKPASLAGKAQRIAAPVWRDAVGGLGETIFVVVGHDFGLLRSKACTLAATGSSEPCWIS